MLNNVLSSRFQLPVNGNNANPSKIAFKSATEIAVNSPKIVKYITENNLEGPIGNKISGDEICLKFSYLPKLCQKGISLKPTVEENELKYLFTTGKHIDNEELIQKDLVKEDLFTKGQVAQLEDCLGSGYYTPEEKSKKFVEKIADILASKLNQIAKKELSSKDS